MFSTCWKFESRKTNVLMFFSFKLNTDLLIRNIHYINGVLISTNIFFRKLIYWERKGNVKYRQNNNKH